MTKERAMDSVKTDAKWKLVPVEPTEAMQVAGNLAVPLNVFPWIGDVYRAMLAASPPAGAEVRVKPLVWHGGHAFWADVGAHYHVSYYSGPRKWRVFSPGLPDGPSGAHFETEAEAKAAAQADYDRRILSALEPTPSTDAVRRQAREEALEEAARELDAIWAAYRKSADVVFDLDVPDAAAKSAAINGIADVVAECAAAVRARALSTPPAGAAALNEGESDRG